MFNLASGNDLDSEEMDGDIDYEDSNSSSIHSKQTASITTLIPLHRKALTYPMDLNDEQEPAPTFIAVEKCTDMCHTPASRCTFMEVWMLYFTEEIGFTCGAHHAVIDPAQLEKHITDDVIHRNQSNSIGLHRAKVQKVAVQHVLEAFADALEHMPTLPILSLTTVISGLELLMHYTCPWCWDITSDIPQFGNIVTTESLLLNVFQQGTLHHSTLLSIFLLFSTTHLPSRNGCKKPTLVQIPVQASACEQPIEIGLIHIQNILYSYLAEVHTFTNSVTSDLMSTLSRYAKASWRDLAPITLYGWQFQMKSPAFESHRWLCTAGFIPHKLPQVVHKYLTTLVYEKVLYSEHIANMTDQILCFGTIWDSSDFHTKGIVEIQMKAEVSEERLAHDASPIVLDQNLSIEEKTLVQTDEEFINELEDSSLDSMDNIEQQLKDLLNRHTAAADKEEELLLHVDLVTYTAPGLQKKKYQLQLNAAKPPLLCMPMEEVAFRKAFVENICVLFGLEAVNDMLRIYTYKDGTILSYLYTCGSLRSNIHGIFQAQASQLLDTTTTEASVANIAAHAHYGRITNSVLATLHLTMEFVTGLIEISQIWQSMLGLGVDRLPE
ncbi:hypothetical protein BDW22DRAFT_1348151 [Trametopsis cervina]|nr:hypothetical protein BDW22DRAFT_1348151 [Trametopsis cervina]